MSDTISLLQSHFERQKNGSVAIPDVGPDGGALIVHFDPLTNGEAQAIRRRANGCDVSAAIITVILKALNPDRTKMFPDTAETVKALTESVDATVIGQIAKAVSGVSAEDDAGN